jgi:hypothetical protein
LEDKYKYARKWNENCFCFVIDVPHITWYVCLPQQHSRYEASTGIEPWWSEG